MNRIVYVVDLNPSRKEFVKNKNRVTVLMKGPKFANYTWEKQYKQYLRDIANLYENSVEIYCRLYLRGVL